VSKEIIKIFVEGTNDVRFIQWVLCRYYPIVPVTYQQKKNSIVKKLINNVKSKENQDYIFLADMDSHSFNCITSKKDFRISEYNTLDDKKKIIIVKEEIESWYVSGINEKCPDDIKNISIPANTENFTKEDFEEIMPPRFDSIIDFMIEIAKCFDLELAKTRNNSFNRLISQLDEISDCISP